MKKILSVMALCITLASCSNKEEHVTSMESVTQMPPDMHNESKYIKIDTGLLAVTIDVSCGMTIKNKTADTMSYNGRLYGFCGKGCKDDFAKDPPAHLNK
jgi:YHS domain-containing protein